MVYTQMYLIFVDLAKTGFLVCIIHLIFTVGNYILKTNYNNVSSVTITIFSTLLSMIPLCHIVMLIILLYHTAILTEKRCHN